MEARKTRRNGTFLDRQSLPRQLVAIFTPQFLFSLRSPREGIRNRVFTLRPFTLALARSLFLARSLARSVISASEAMICGTVPSQLVVFCLK